MRQTRQIALYILIFIVTLLASGRQSRAYGPAASSVDSVIYYGEQRVVLGPKSFLIDGSLSDQEIVGKKYMFNSLQKAVQYLKDGTASEPMRVYIAPYVYWLDDPDDPALRVPKPGENVPFGLEIDCQWLSLIGLSDDPSDVILAANRGQTMGAKGNFTMLRIRGEGPSAENITFGNYCNIDLVYPKNPSLNKKKRGSAIVQAQLVFCDGDRVFARNCRFISRLNLCPFVGGKRTLFDRCYFELTDDALNGNAVYLRSTFHFYGSKPFWGASRTGAVFLDCDIHSFVESKQYFVKTAGQVTLIDTDIDSQTASYVGWKALPDAESSYQYQVRFNSKPYTVGHHHPQHVHPFLATQDALLAYRFTHSGKVYYNVYNLLAGKDQWDPLGYRSLIEAQEHATGIPLTHIPTQLRFAPHNTRLEAKRDSLCLQTQLLLYSGEVLPPGSVSWTAERGQKSVNIRPMGDGRCVVIPVLDTDTAQHITIYANHVSGLRAATTLEIVPQQYDAPSFLKSPKLQLADGILHCSYTLDSSYPDETRITWSRSRTSDGRDAIPVQISPDKYPLKQYRLTAADSGYYIHCRVEPKHIRSRLGLPVDQVFATRLTPAEVGPPDYSCAVPLATMPTQNQPQLIPGFWSLDAYAPADTREYDWQVDTSKQAWYYGVGVDGAMCDTGFVQAVQGARMRYTPLARHQGDMSIQFTAVPAKTAGQGFGSARAQYLDVYIKFDHSRLTGYALRIIRTTKYADAVDFQLLHYKDGHISPISPPVSTTVFRTPCSIQIAITDHKLSVKAITSTENRKSLPSGVRNDVMLEAVVGETGHGGVGFQHTGTVGSGATLIKDIVIDWN